MQILYREVIAENGCFKTERVWAKGWLNIPGSYHIWGMTGKETAFIRTYIVPIVIFEVIPCPGLKSP
jgi:hypothetical protein